MKFLLDTCVISALRKPQANASLVEWISEVDESDLYLSVITIGELEKGVGRLPASKNKAAVSGWIRHAVANRFGHRILPILDAFIAATAIAADCTVVTRNTKDFADCGVRLLDP